MLRDRTGSIPYISSVAVRCHRSHRGGMYAGSLALCERVGVRMRAPAELAMLETCRRGHRFPIVMI